MYVPEDIPNGERYVSPFWGNNPEEGMKKFRKYPEEYNFHFHKIKIIPVKHIDASKEVYVYQVRDLQEETIFYAPPGKEYESISAAQEAAEYAVDQWIDKFGIVF